MQAKARKESPRLHQIWSNNITTMLKGITETDKTGVLCSTSHHVAWAYDAQPAFDLFPIDYGYKLSENGESLEMHWFDGNQTPDIIEKLEIDGDEGNNSDEDDADVDDSDSEDEESNDEFDDAEI